MTQMAALRTVALIATAAVLSACSPALTTLEPARLVPPHHLQITTGLSASNPSGDLRNAFDAASAMRVDNDGLTAEQVTTLMNGAAAVVVSPPSLGAEVSATYGLSRRFAAGVRTTGNTVRANVRMQVLRIAPGFYGALGLGASVYFYGFPVQQFSDVVSLSQFQRQELDVPLLFGWSGRYGHIWFGPKLVLSRYGAVVEACTQTNGDACAMTANVNVSGTAAYFGGQIGAAIGYGRYWFAAELTAMHVRTNAHVNLDMGGMSAALDFGASGVTLTPGIAFIGWF